MNKFKGSFMLLIAAFCWGTTFVAQSSAADNIKAFTFNGVRSLVGAAFLGVLIVILNKRNSKESNLKKPDNKRLIIGGICCGLVLFAASNFQQSGIVAYPEGVASSGRSGFLTAIYVIIVAFASKLFGKKLHKIIYPAAVICLAGMYLLCMSDGFESLYFGDLLGIICAFCFAGHIMVVDYFNDCDSVKLSCIQFITNGVLSVICMVIFEKPEVEQIIAAWLPIMYAGIFSSGIAYTLQIAGQKYADPAVAAIVMSLESVFAVIGGFLVLGEVLSVPELIGCVLVFTAVIMAQIPEMRRNGGGKGEEI